MPVALIVNFVAHDAGRRHNEIYPAWKKDIEQALEYTTWLVSARVPAMH
jgi:hypothetical protein